MPLTIYVIRIVRTKKVMARMNCFTASNTATMGRTILAFAHHNMTPPGRKHRTTS